MDVFEAVNSRIACRQFVDKPVDLETVRDLIRGAARAASSLNLQPWNVYAVTGEPLRKIVRQASEAIAHKELRTFETEYPECPEELWDPYNRRRSDFGWQLYGALGIDREDAKGRLEQIKRNFMFFNAPVGVFIAIDRRLGPGQWADLGGYVNTLAFLARGTDSTRVHRCCGYACIRSCARRWASLRADALLRHGHRPWRPPPPGQQLPHPTCGGE